MADEPVTTDDWKPRKYADGLCSDLFERAFLGSGSLSTLCEPCGRVHFCSSYPNDFEEGELEELEAKAEQNPDRYVDSNDYVGWGKMAGKQVVFDCPCGYARWYEHRILSDRNQILNFLRSYAEDRLRTATELKKAADHTVQATDLADQAEEEADGQPA